MLFSFVYRTLGLAQALDGQQPAILRSRFAQPAGVAAAKEVAVRSQHLTSIDAIRFGETMRRVAAATNDATEGGLASREGRPPRWTAT